MALFGFFITAFSALLSVFPIEVSGPILYLLHRGEAEKAFSSYLEYAHEKNRHDFSLLQQAAKVLIEEGMTLKDKEITQLCMFGAGIGTSTDLLPILSKGVKSADLKIQLIAISYLSKMHDDEADEILLDALSSPFLLARLEALFELSKKNHPAVLSHIHSLAVKVPEEIHPLFSKIAINLDSLDATRYIKSKLADASLPVRIETILAIAEQGREDFLPQIRTLSCAPSYVQLESCAMAFGKLKDYHALNRLKELAQHQEEAVKLSASLSLFELGERGYLNNIKNLAQKGSQFAIYALGQLREGAELLIELTDSKERDVRLNAMLALLNQHNSQALPLIEEFLIDDGKEIGFWQVSSPGGTLKIWKTIPSASHQSKYYPNLLAQTAIFKEELLAQCIDFEEDDFLKIARKIFEKQEHALIPTLMQLLLNRKSEKVVAFLKEGYKKAGAPLIRNYCMLALYRLNENGPYEEQLIRWIKEWGKVELIRFKDENDNPSFKERHDLTPEESSRFLVDACETLALSQTESAIEALIHTIAHGNPKNRYALAGLLILTTE